MTVFTYLGCSTDMQNPPGLRPAGLIAATLSSRRYGFCFDALSLAASDRILSMAALSPAVLAPVLGFEPIVVWVLRDVLYPAAVVVEVAGGLYRAAFC